MNLRAGKYMQSSIKNYSWSSHSGSVVTTWLVSMRMPVLSLASLSGLRIPHCCGCGVGWQLQLHADPSLGTSMCYRHSSKKKKKFLIIKNTFLKLVILLLFYVGEEARIWGHWNSCLDVHLIQAFTSSCFLHPEFPAGHAVVRASASLFV